MTNKSTKILLINAINTSVEVETRYPNLGLAYLVSVIRKNIKEKVEFKIIDRDVLKEGVKFKPDLVGITSVSQNYNLAIEYAKYYYKKNIPVIMGGIHITLLPKTLPKYCIAGCIGEGEKTFEELVRLFIDKGKFFDKDIKMVDGVVYWSKGEVAASRPRELHKVLDEIPFPARDLVTVDKHSYMFTSRGCPYRCSFCASSRFWDKLRFFSAEYVVDEIEILVNDYGVEMISFFDDLFVANFERLNEIYKLLKKKNLIGRVRFTCSCRANLVNKRLVKLLKKMGVVSVGMGLESGNEEVLSYLKGGTVSVKHNYQAVRLLKEEGISANASFVIGSPMETKMQVMDTYNFIKKSNLDLFDVYILTPYPGTPVWDYALKRKLVAVNDFDWSRLNVNAYQMDKKDIILVSEKLTTEELVGYYNKFRRLRLVHNVLKVLRHPMAGDLPKLAYGMAKESIRRLIKN